MEFLYKERASKEALDTANYLINSLEVEEARAYPIGSIDLTVKGFASRVYINKRGELVCGNKEEFVKEFKKIQERERKVLELADKIEELLDWDSIGKYIHLRLEDKFS